MVVSSSRKALALVVAGCLEACSPEPLPPRVARVSDAVAADAVPPPAPSAPKPERRVAPLLPTSPDPQPPELGSIGDLPLVSGETLKNCKVEYRTLGTLNAAKSNVVVWATWFSGITKDLLELVGPGKVVDSTKYYVVLLGALANGVSSSPSNSLEQPRLRFPAVTIRDMVESQHRLLTRVLGLSHVRAVTGISMGGMQAFQWGISYPDFMDRLMPIVGSPRLAPYDLLLWQANLDAIERDPTYLGGNYLQQPVLPVVQQLADLNLTSFEEYNGRVSRQQVAEAHRTLAPPRFDANDRVRQLRAMIEHDVSMGTGGSLESAAKLLKAKMLVVVNDRDAMVTPGPALEIAKLANAEVLMLRGNCGHKAPSCEQATIAARSARFLE
jgi:homoserine O-acetyltransferase/O-succinyltransferase